jgi:hypothetical protein
MTLLTVQCHPASQGPRLVAFRIDAFTSSRQAHASHAQTAALFRFFRDTPLFSSPLSQKTIPKSRRSRYGLCHRARI